MQGDSPGKKDSSKGGCPTGVIIPRDRTSVPLTTTPTECLIDALDKLFASVPAMSAMGQVAVLRTTPAWGACEDTDYRSLDDLGYKFTHVGALDARAPTKGEDCE